MIESLREKFEEKLHEISKGRLRYTADEQSYKLIFFYTFDLEKQETHEIAMSIYGKELKIDTVKWDNALQAEFRKWIQVLEEEENTARITKKNK